MVVLQEADTASTPSRGFHYAYRHMLLYVWSSIIIVLGTLRDLVLIKTSLL